MRMARRLMSLVFLVSCSCLSLAQNDVVKNGTVVEQAPYEFPSYDRLPGGVKRIYTQASYEAHRNSPNLELLKIKYMSAGRKIVGFIYKPKTIVGKRLPAIIYNRGGIGEAAKTGNENFQNIYEMYRYASAGFIVLASQYGGVDGSEGKDEVGGSDLADVMNLLPLAESLGYVDTNALYIYGVSRGAQMALQAIRQGLPVRAAVIVGTPTNWADTLQRSPRFIQPFSQMWPDFETRREEHIRNRSAIFWAEQINVPLLILHGGGDQVIPVSQIMAFANKLNEAGKLFELIIYAKDDHPVNLNREDRLKRAFEWFNNPPTIFVSTVLDKAIRERGIEAAVKQYHELRSKEKGYDFDEASINRLGYTLLGEGKVKEAVQIFQLNVEAHPQSFNVFDSLGEAYAASGERDLAIKNYKKSLELNPQNTSAIEALKRLGQ